MSGLSRLESGSLSKMQPVETGHFPSLHHSQLTLTLTLTRLEAGETFFKSVNSTSTTSQLCHSQLDIVQCACYELEAFQRCTMSTGQWPAGLLHHSGSLRTRHDEPLIAVKIRNLDYVHDTTLIFIHLINIWWKSTKRRIFLLQEKYRILQEEKVCCCCILSGPLPSPDTRHNCFKFEAFDDTSRKKKE